MSRPSTTSARKALTVKTYDSDNYQNRSARRRSMKYDLRSPENIEDDDN